MRTKFKPWAKPFLEEHKEFVIDEESFSSLFLDKKVCLEIGCGKGDFIIGLASNNPDKIYVAIEKVETVAGIAAKKMVELHLPNLFLYPNDITKLFPCIKENQIEAIYLNFSDPWPKKRHEKRRLTHISFIKEYGRILSSSGKIFVKTDNVNLFDFSLKSFSSLNWVIEEQTYDYSEVKADDCETEYEKKFRSEGKKINRMVVHK